MGSWVNAILLVGFLSIVLLGILIYEIPQADGFSKIFISDSSSSIFALNVVEENNNVYIFWTEEDADSEYAFEYKIMISVSTNGGETFSQPKMVIPESGDFYNIGAVASNGIIYLVWTDEGVPVISISRDRGNSFGTPQELYPGRSGDWAIEGMEIGASGPNFYSIGSAYSGCEKGYDDFFGYHLFLKRSTNEGKNFEEHKMINCGEADSGDFLFSNSDDNLYVVFNRYVDVIFKRSTDNGKTFEKSINLSRSPLLDSYLEEITSWENYVYVLWKQFTENYEEKWMLSVSSDYGYGFKTFELTNVESYYRSIAANRNLYFLIENKDQEFILMESTDRGKTFSSHEISDSVDEFSFFVSPNDIYVLWTEKLEGNYQLFFSKNPIEKKSEGMTEVYRNQEHGFSIEYPKEMKVDDEISEWESWKFYFSASLPKDFSASTPIEYFAEEQFISVSFESSLEMLQYKDESYLEKIFEEEKEYCQNEITLISDREANRCIDQNLIESSKITVNGKKAYKVIVGWTFQAEPYPGSPDKEEIKLITAILDVPVDDGRWQVYIVIPKSVWIERENEFVDVLESFTLLQDGILEKYVNEDYGFSIKYPKEMKVDDEIGEWESWKFYFYADLPGVYYSEDQFLSVGFHPTNFEKLGFKDEAYLEQVFEEERKICTEEYTIEEVGYDCLDQTLIDSSILSVNGKQGHEIIVSWTKRFEPSTIVVGEFFDYVSAIMDIPVENGRWLVYLELPEEEWNYNENLYRNVLESFTLLQESSTIIEPPISRLDINYDITDDSGNTKLSFDVSQTVLIKVEVLNNLENTQHMAILYQIQDEDGNTVGGVSVIDELDLGGGQTVTKSVAWTPDNAGTYTIEIFAWESIDNPSALAPPVSAEITVIPKEEKEIEYFLGTYVTEKYLIYDLQPTQWISQRNEDIGAKTAFTAVAAYALTAIILGPTANPAAAFVAEHLIAEGLGEYWDYFYDLGESVRINSPNVGVKAIDEDGLVSYATTIKSGESLTIVIALDLSTSGQSGQTELIVKKWYKTSQPVWFNETIQYPGDPNDVFSGNHWILKKEPIPFNEVGRHIVGTDWPGFGLWVDVTSPDYDEEELIAKLKSGESTTQVDDSSLSSALTYLAEHDRIKIDSTISSFSDLEFPHWLKEMATLYMHGEYSELEFVNLIQFLLDNKII